MPEIKFILLVYKRKKNIRNEEYIYILIRNYSRINGHELIRTRGLIICELFMKSVTLDVYSSNQILLNLERKLVEKE